MKKINTKAFTLVETLVAISILITSIVAPLTIAAQSLFSARYSRDQVIATYLAQESVEMMRYLRDRNMIAILANSSGSWLNFIPQDRWFSPDWTGVRNGLISTCSSISDPKTCPYLKYDGAYNLSSGESTKFKRAVKVTVNPSLPDEAILEARVYWRTGAFNERSVIIKTRIYNWAVVE
jgi:type II secretory pathway pseudopilin PulG